MKSRAWGVDAYRISRGADRWRRRWQAEWPNCQRAPRAWTRRGVLRKADRWWRHGTDWKLVLRPYRSSAKRDQRVMDWLHR